MSIGPNELYPSRDEERRSSPRFTIDAPVMLLGQGGWAMARTRDISRGGVAVVGSNLNALVGLRVNHLYFELPKLAGVDTDAHLLRASDSECVFGFDRCPHDAEVALRAWLHACILRAARIGSATRERSRTRLTQP